MLALAAGVHPGPAGAAGGPEGEAAPAWTVSEPVPRELREAAERIPGTVSPHVRLDRLALTPYRAVLEGRARDLDGLADLLESLPRGAGLGEPELARAEDTGAQVTFTVVLPVPPPPAEAEPAVEPSWFDSDFFNGLEYALFRLLMPDQPALPGEPASHRPGSLHADEPLAGDGTATREGAGLVALAIAEVTVEEIHQTWIGAVALVRARGARYLVREGDRFADGEVDTIGFLTPTIAWLRFRRRVPYDPESPVSLAYRPVVWLLAGDRPNRPALPRTAPSDRGVPPPPGVGGAWNRRVEVHRLEPDADADVRDLLPWRWELTAESAPRLFVEVIEAVAGGDDPAAVFATIDRLAEDAGPGATSLFLTQPFGDIDFVFTSRAGVVGAVATELGVPVPVLPSPTASHSAPSPAAGAGSASSRCGRDLDDLETIECVLENAAYDSLSYDPGRRSDPLRDPSAASPPWWAWEPGRASEALPRWTSSIRPAGVPGLLIDELEVDAVFFLGIAIAEVRTPTERCFLKAGDRLYDGDVVAVDEDGVWLRQIVRDPWALEPFEEVFKRADPRWSGPRPTAWPGGSSIGSPAAMDGSDESDRTARRDPFHPLDGAVPPEEQRSSLAELSCRSLAGTEAEPLGAVLERAERRVAHYRSERSLAGLVRGDGSGAGARRYLDDVARSAALDLARLFAGELDDLEGILEVASPPPAEMLALLGDLEVIAGRPVEAAAVYRLAEDLSPAVQPLCGRLHAGRLYGAESVRFARRDGGSPRYHLSGYLLAWDPADGRVLERHFLPGPPEALAAEQTTLRIEMTGQPGSARVVGTRFEPPPPAPRSEILAYLWPAVSGTQLAANFLDLRGPEPFAVRRDADDRLPLTPAELDEALEAAIARDPTQPWVPFLLGQSLWRQGRREEAETSWRKVWEGDWSVSRYELLRMIALHEAWGQPELADRGFPKVLAAYRDPARRVHPRDLELEVRDAAVRLDAAAAPDPRRRHLWRLRLREISDAPTWGDAFGAALWTAEFERHGDHARASAEATWLERARSDVRDASTRTAWLDYSCYGVIAALAMLLAHLAVFSARLVRRLAGRTGRGAGGGPPPLHLPRFGVELLGLLAVLGLTLSLTVFAASYLGWVLSLPTVLGEGPRDLFATDETGLLEVGTPTRSELFEAWITSGAIEPVYGSPGPLVAAALRLRDRGAATWIVLAAGVTVALWLAALPAGLILSSGRARAAVGRWVPGGCHFRSGARLRGLLVFGLAVFAIVPLSWLAVARVSSLPAPGPTSAVSCLVAVGVTPAPAPPGGEPPSWSARSRRLRSAYFGRLLAVYPAARPFWALVLAALAVSVAAHLRRLRAVDRAPPPAA